MSASKSPILSVFKLGLLLHNLNREAERRAGLTLVQWCVLNQLLEMPATSAQKLAEALQLHPSTLTQTLKRLQRREFLLVAQDPRDSRKKMISITRKGLEALRSSRANIGSLEKELIAINTSLGAVETHLDHLRMERIR